MEARTLNNVYKRKVRISTMYILIQSAKPNTKTTNTNIDIIKYYLTTSYK